MKAFLNRLINDTRGQDLVEYSLMAGFVALAAAAIFPGIVTFMQRFSPLPPDYIRIAFVVMAMAILVLILLRRRRESE